MCSHAPLRTIGFFGGSFNPPHLGHTALADAIAASGMVDEVWMVLSPRNPLKAVGPEMAPDSDRLAMLRLAVEGHPGLKVSDVELSLPRPAYAGDTLEKRSLENPGCRFRLIIGEDNWRIFDRWRSAALLRERYAPIVYRRGDSTEPIVGADTLADAPLLPVSSTEVRRRIAADLPVNNLISHGVYNYIITHGLYGARV